MSTGSATTGGDKNESDLSAIIAELRTALGGVPEIAKLYGKPEGADASKAYDAFSLRDDVDEMKHAYGSPSDFDDGHESEASEGKSDASENYVSSLDGLRAELPKSAYSKLGEENETSESDSADGEHYIGDLKLNPEPLTPAVSKPSEAEASESKDDESATYIGDFKDLKLKSSPDVAPIQPAVAPLDLAANFEKVRKETDHRLAKLAKFLPDNVREAVDKKFADAVKLAQPKSDEGYMAATEALTKLQSSLDSKGPELRTKENEHLRKQIQATLDREGGTLEPADKKGFVDHFATLDKDLNADEGEAKTQLESLQTLSADVDNAIRDRLKAVSDLCVDFERLAPIVERALLIEGDKHDDLEKTNTEIKEGFGGQFVKDGLSVDAIQAKVSELESKVREAFKDFTLDDAKEEQKSSLPASPDSLKPKGAALGRGAFGEVFELKNDGKQKLVGKSFSGDNLDAKKEMEHEAEIYARIGEHPNIAKCYGIHEVDGKSMLVMDKIEGQDVEKVLEDLHQRLKKGKIKREEYLAATQHIFKGTLMGLAHMESIGLVHKDIKGDNVKFDTRTNQALLIDMGLAQSEGEHENPKNYFPMAPPEQFIQKKDAHDKVVTNLWDSFTVGKMLFEEMEREADGVRNLMVTGGEAIKQDAFKPGIREMMAPIVGGARAAVKRTDSGGVEAKTDAKGQLVGQALKPADSAKDAGKAGKFGASTQYVDFMNRLTHPDPKQRMTPSEALKHPFMTDTFMSGEELDKVFGVATDRKTPVEEKESDEASGEENKGPRIDTDALAAAYSKGEKKEYEPLLGEGSEGDSEEEKGPRIDTDALAEAYGKEQKKNSYDIPKGKDSKKKSGKDKGPRISKEELDEAYFGKKSDSEEEGLELGSDDAKGPRIDTDALAEAYSGKQPDDDLDSLEEEVEEKKSSKGKKKSKK